MGVYANTIEAIRQTIAPVVSPGTVYTRLLYLDTAAKLQSACAVDDGGRSVLLWATITRRTVSVPELRSSRGMQFAARRTHGYRIDVYHGFDSDEARGAEARHQAMVDSIVELFDDEGDPALTVRTRFAAIGVDIEPATVEAIEPREYGGVLVYAATITIACTHVLNSLGY